MVFQLGVLYVVPVLNAGTGSKSGNMARELLLPMLNSHNHARKRGLATVARRQGVRDGEGDEEREGDEEGEGV